MSWNKWIRRTHHWLGLLFTVAVIANIVAVAVQGGKCLRPGKPTRRCFPLAVLWLGGLLVIVLPYAAW